MRELKIEEFSRKDHKKAIRFAITGMQFNWFFEKQWMIRLYGRYFWYQELSKATEMHAVYYGDELAGVLLAQMEGETPGYRTPGMAFYMRLYEFFCRMVKGGDDLYEKANGEMLEAFKAHCVPDGEILFLAANPTVPGRGIGSLLLREFEKGKKGKTVFLYTDNGCTYHFYEHRGFKRMDERDVSIVTREEKRLLRCFLYAKEIQ